MAASNAALALVQLGDEQAAIKEMRKASRRAPGSADLRAALAALYWSQVPHPTQEACRLIHPRHTHSCAVLSQQMLYLPTGVNMYTSRLASVLLMRDCKA